MSSESTRPIPNKITPEMLSERLNNLTNMVGQRLHLKEVSAQALEFAQEHPLLTVFCAVVIAMASVPIVGFIFFVMTTLCVSFIGFVFVEGTLMTLAGVVMSGVLVFICLLALGLTALLALAWFTINLTMDMMQCTRKKINETLKNKEKSQVEDVSGGEEIIEKE